MLRLFTALELPQDLCEKLRLLQGGIFGARWTAMENFHLTLNFIGNVDEAAAEDINDILSDIRAPAFTLTPRGVGSFAQGDDPKVLWAGVEKSEGLSRLKEKIDHAFEKNRIPFERRKYSPHITLARFREPDELKIIDFMKAHGDFTAESFSVDAFALYGSTLTKHGPAYEVLNSYPLLP